MLAKLLTAAVFMFANDPLIVLPAVFASPAIFAVLPAIPVVPSSIPFVSIAIALVDSSDPSDTYFFISPTLLPVEFARICQAGTPASTNLLISSE